MRAQIVHALQLSPFVCLPLLLLAAPISWLAGASLAAAGSAAFVGGLVASFGLAAFHARQSEGEASPSMAEGVVEVRAPEATASSGGVLGGVILTGPIVVFSPKPASFDPDAIFDDAAARARIHSLVGRLQHVIVRGRMSVAIVKAAVQLEAVLPEEEQAHGAGLLSHRSRPAAG